MLDRLKLIGMQPTIGRQAWGAIERCEVRTVLGGRIADIRGFDDRKAAAARAGAPT
jgi:hypothetical protein